jgi:hypothetical protein
MATIGDLPYLELEFNRLGKVSDQSQLQAVVRLVGGGAITDLIVVAHGWNNNNDEARALYKELFENVSAQMRNRMPGDARKMAVVGVLWPSKKFGDVSLIPGGAATLGNADISEDFLVSKLDGLKGVFHRSDNASLRRAKKLVDDITASPDARQNFIDILRSLVPRNPKDTRDDASDVFFLKDAQQLFSDLSAPSFASPWQGDTGGALAFEPVADHSTSFGDVSVGVKAAAWRLLNYTTYYQMKERAGLVGGALNAALKKVGDVAPTVPLHLVGHSFGARLMSAAVDGREALNIHSLALLQGAFSHNGFGQRFDGSHDGFFRGVVGLSKVRGAIVVTYTKNDRAVGIAYPIASRISGANASAIGDAGDRFGGMGRNGALHLKADEASALVTRLLDHNAEYQFAPGLVHNLLADDFVKDHSDICNPAVANAIRSAFCITA